VRKRNTKTKKQRREIQDYHVERKGYLLGNSGGMTEGKEGKNVVGLVEVLQLLKGKSIPATKLERFSSHTRERAREEEETGSLSNKQPEIEPGGNPRPGRKKKGNISYE